MNDRDLRVQKTKLVLTETLIRALQARPFSKVSVKELCDESLVNRATFYKHYHDRNDLLYDVFGRLTIAVDQVPVDELLANPFLVVPTVVKEPLPTIILKQQTDMNFYGTYRQFFYNYYMSVFQPINFKGKIPKELAAYTLVNNVFSFTEWQTDFHVDISANEMNRMFREMIRLPEIE